MVLAPYNSPMAEGTRFSQLYESVATLKLSQVSNKNDLDKMKQQMSQVSEIKQQMSQVSEILQTLVATQARTVETAEGRTFTEYAEGESSGGNRGIHTRSLQLDILKFDGENPLGWVYKNG